MKCPECGASNPYKYGMRCSCGYCFCLDPKMDNISDGRFVAAIRSASQNDTLYFTENQLYTAICRKQAFGLNLPLVGALFRLFHTPPTQSRVNSCIFRWQSSGRKIERLILAPGLHTPPPEWDEPDVYDYGVERVLVVEHDVLVDLLVLNGFHTAQRTLVISESGYPTYLVPQVARILRDNPEVPVCLLHDSTAEGMEMEQRVRQSSVLEGTQAVVDLGLTPETVAQLRCLRATKPDRHGNAIPVDWIPYGVLTATLAPSLEQKVPLAAVLASTGSSTYAGGIFDFG